jgi:hypothetical protein
VFYEKLEPLYYSFVDALEWKEHALSALIEIGGNTVEMKVKKKRITTNLPKTAGR